MKTRFGALLLSVTLALGTGCLLLPPDDGEGGQGGEAGSGSSESGNGAPTGGAGAAGAGTSVGAGAGSGAGNPGSEETPGAIACGADTCVVGEEKCCVDESGQGVCEPENGYPTCSGATPTVYSVSCDDAADCGGGQVCCFDPWGETGVVSCQTSCLIYEMCIAGGSCAPGLDCLTYEESPTGGVCWPSVEPEVFCGPQTCSGDASACCWDPATQTGYCDVSCEGTSEFRCDSRSDCYPYFCCSNAFGSECRADCVSAFFGALCEDDADCPPGLMGPQTCVPTGDDPDLPFIGGACTEQ